MKLTLDGKPFSLDRPHPARLKRLIGVLDGLRFGQLFTNAEIARLANVEVDSTLNRFVSHELKGYWLRSYGQGRERLWGSKKTIAAAAREMATR